MDLESKLLKAKVELMTRSVFISTICLSVKHIITKLVPTAAVSATTIRYNPKLLESLTVQQLAAVIAHECWHLAFQHGARRGDRDHLIWNAAGDYVINLMLNKNGLQLPKWALMDSKYADMSTDQVYDDLIKNKVDFTPEDLMVDLSDDPLDANSNVTDIIIRAHTQAKASGCNMKGEIPDEIARTIDELLNPKFSWDRRNRRYRHAYMPSLHSYGLGHLTFAIDTSGSVSDDALQGMLSEIKGIRDTFSPERMTIIDCDARIHNIHEIDQTTDILSLKFNGGGGTSFQPVLDYVSDNPTQALVYFTDLYGEENLEKVEYPIMWICTSDHEPATIGETVYVN